jgi:acyl dehydratase
VNEQYFEDYPAGRTFRLGPLVVNHDEVVDFARRYDPQPIHVDPLAAKEGPYGGIIASGWHTCALVMRMLVDEYISPVSALGSPGIDELRWLSPVRPGDELTVDVTVVDSRLSRSKPDRGIVRSRVEASNDAGVRVLHMIATNMILTGPHPS